MSSHDQNDAAPAAPTLPLFYREPVLLSSQIHADWRLKTGDAGFAVAAPYVPIVAGEITAATRDYPIVFAAADAQPIAVLGLERRNLFVEGGRWAEEAYVPAYVRRYPFGFVATANPAGFALAIDGAADRLVRDGSEGALLFENGVPSALTREAMDFCGVFGREVEATKLFASALAEKDLLVDRRADATLPDGRTLGLDSFQIVDAEKFGALADDVVVDWHKRGWLALVHFHLASLERFSDLLARQSKSAPVATASQQDGSDADGAAPAEPVQSKKA